MQGNAFARSKLMFAAIAAAMALGGEAQRTAMAGIGSYVSRGKGQGGGIRAGSSKNTTAQGKRAAVKTRNVKRHKLAISRA